MRGQFVEKFYICSETNCQMNRTLTDWDKLTTHLDDGHKIVTSTQIINALRNQHENTLGFEEQKMDQFKKMINRQINEWETSLINYITRFVDSLYQKSEKELQFQISEMIQQTSQRELEQIDILSKLSPTQNNIENLISLYNKSDPYNSYNFQDQVNTIQECIDMYMKDFQFEISTIINDKLYSTNNLFQTRSLTQLNSIRVNQNENLIKVDQLPGLDSNQPTVSSSQGQTNQTQLKGYKTLQQQQQTGVQEKEMESQSPLKGYKKLPPQHQDIQTEIIQSSSKSTEQLYEVNSQLQKQKQIQKQNQQQLEQQISEQNIQTQPQKPEKKLKLPTKFEICYIVGSINYTLSDKHIKFYSPYTFYAKNSAFVIFDLQIEKENSSQLQFQYELNPLENNQFCYTGILDLEDFTRDNLKQKNYPNTYGMDSLGNLYLGSRKERSNIKLKQKTRIKISYEKGSKTLSFKSGKKEKNFTLEFEDNPFFYFIYFDCITIQVFNSADNPEYF